MCKVKSCSRPESVGGLCGFHALQGYYRAEAVKGVGLAVARVPRPPRVIVVEPPPDPAAADRG